MFKNKLRQTASLFLISLWCVSAGAASLPKVDQPATQPKKNKPQWVSIFNGKDLTGWTPKFRGQELGVNYKNTYQVKDGLLKVSYDAYKKWGSQFGHLFYKNSYSHYKFRITYRFVGKQIKGGPGWAFRNNGIMIHCQSPQSMAKNQKFPVSIEVQMLGGKAKGNRTNGNLCTPGTNVVYQNKLQTRHVINSKSKTYRGDQWVTLEIHVQGSEVIKHILDGKVVLEYTKPQLDPRDPDAKRLLKKSKNKNLLLDRGYISIQAESHPVDIKSIEIMDLSPEKTVQNKKMHASTHPKQ